MDFGLSEEQELLQETVRGWVANECPAPRLRELFDGDAAFDEGLWKGLSEIGIAGLAIPEEFDGAGMEVLDLALVSEVLGEGAVPVPFLGHSLAALAIAAAGSDAQKSRWLPALATGELVGAVALGEGDGRWLASEWSVRDEGGVLSGTKRFVPHGAAAGLFVVGTAGGGLAVVEAGATGVKLEAEDGIDRTRRLDTLTLENAAGETLPGGAEAAGRLRDAALVLLAADAFGAAWKLIRMTIEYTSQREQFDTPLTQFQGVKHELANNAVAIEPTRGLFWYAAHALDHIPAEAEESAALAKSHITDRAVDIGRSCIELHGGIGFTWECDAHMWLKRVMFDRTWLGGPDVHRERVAAISGWAAEASP